MNLKRILTIASIVLILTAVSIWMGQLSYSWLPPQASNEARLIDELFSFLVTLGTFILLGVTGLITYSVIFHRAGRYDTSDGPPIEGNTTLEIVWTAIPLLLVFWIAWYSYQIYDKMAIRGPMEIAHLHSPMEMESAYAAETDEPLGKPSVNIDVMAKQWSWVFHYPDKDLTSTELHLPVDRRAHLVLESADVLHGFFIPAFRVKQDIIPQRSIDFEFTPIQIGKYRLRDSQYSGTYFAAMQTDVVVESQEDFERWLLETSIRKPSVAPNQAAAEYAIRDKNSWATIIPAPPPVVNYHP